MLRKLTAMINLTCINNLLYWAFQYINDLPRRISTLPIKNLIPRVFVGRKAQNYKCSCVFQFICSMHFALADLGGSEAGSSRSKIVRILDSTVGFHIRVVKWLIHKSPKRTREFDCTLVVVLKLSFFSWQSSWLTLWSRYIQKLHAYINYAKQLLDVGMEGWQGLGNDAESYRPVGAFGLTSITRVHL